MSAGEEQEKVKEDSRTCDVKDLQEGLFPQWVTTDSVIHLKKLMSGWRNSPRVPSTHTITNTHRKIRSMTMATYFQSSST